MKRLFFALVAALAFAVPAAPATAADFTLLGTASLQGTDVSLVSDFSDAATSNDFGAIAFTVPAGTTFGSLSNLSAVFNVTDDGCGGGSPRFQISLANGQTVMVHFGPSPNFTGCALNTWLNTGNLIGNNDAGRYEITPGFPSLTYAQALALVGAQQVTGVSLVADGGWFFADKEQTVLVRSVTINNTTSTFAPNGGQGGGVSPGQFCKTLRTSMGTGAFNELWGTNANSRNGMGKCVSAVAHARNAGKTEQQILGALAACKANGLKGAALGACVAANDGLAATETEARETKANQGKKAKPKGQGNGNGNGPGNGQGKGKGKK
jgi:hypothetical protein